MIDYEIMFRRSLLSPSSCTIWGMVRRL